MSPQWTSSDAWVFAAIAGTGPEDACTLVQIVGYADAINHAILLESEFLQAVPRLIAAGLVGMAGDRYWQTPAGRALSSSWSGLFGWIEAVPPALARLGPPVDSAWALPSGVFDASVQAYLSR